MRFVPVDKCVGKARATPRNSSNSRRPVSRVLSLRRRKGQPFLCDARYRAPDATNPDGRAGMPPAAALARPARRPYSVLLPVGFTLPPLLPGARCALAAPFHPCPSHGFPWACGGLFSVALSLGSPPPAVSRHRIPVEPGLSSSRFRPAAARPSGGETPGLAGQFSQQKREGRSSFLKKRTKKLFPDSAAWRSTDGQVGLRHDAYRRHP
jgi:hypothetical protein